MTIFTVGHSNHSLEAFLALLKQHHITAIADVRSMPYSRYVPHFNREPLRTSLEQVGIVYADLGTELGARPADPDCYLDGRVRFEKFAQQETFHAGLQRVMTGSEKYRIALMCAEKEPLDCHRGILIARQLDLRNVTVEHILDMGTLELHAKTLTRLLRKVGIAENDLFHSREELILQAYARREEQIAYRPK